MSFKSLKLKHRFQAWLGEEGASFFKGLKEEHGSILVVLPGEFCPHPVHLREGMTVRNWMRRQPEFKGWGSDLLDETWAQLVEWALDLRPTPSER